MKSVLFRSDALVTLVGAGPVSDARLRAALALAPRVVAADGGADHALPEGYRLEAVIGDMDSVCDPEALAARGIAVHPIADQDSTDLEKCLVAIEAPMVLGVGFLGGRVDHDLAAMNALVRHPPGVLVLLGERDVCFHCPRCLSLDLPAGTRVSLFPMRPVRGVGSEGLRWPLAGLAFAPDAGIGTSNAATGGRVTISLDGPGMLVILPQSMLRQVVAVLGETP
jgi:thiamine pyrophosphokinase